MWGNIIAYKLASNITYRCTSTGTGLSEICKMNHPSNWSVTYKQYKYLLVLLAFIECFMTTFLHAHSG